MNLATFKDRINRAQIDPRPHSIDADSDEAYCIIADRPGAWIAYYSERGVRIHAKTHSEQCAAYDDLYERLISDPTTRTGYKGPPKPEW